MENLGLQNVLAVVKGSVSEALPQTQTLVKAGPSSLLSATRMHTPLLQPTTTSAGPTLMPAHPQLILQLSPSTIQFPATLVHLMPTLELAMP